eukprot:3662787-Pyramimonas_sp.AAC.1
MQVPATVRSGAPLPSDLYEARSTGGIAGQWAEVATRCAEIAGKGKGSETVRASLGVHDKSGALVAELFLGSHCKPT